MTAAPAADLASLMLTTQEAAVVFRVSERTVVRRIADGVIPVVDIGDGSRIPGAFVAFVLREALRTGRAVLEVLGIAWAAMQEATS
jgi:excisionase family DNA binding protein